MLASVDVGSVGVKTSGAGAGRRGYVLVFFQARLQDLAVVFHRLGLLLALHHGGGFLGFGGGRERGVDVAGFQGGSLGRHCLKGVGFQRGRSGSFNADGLTTEKVDDCKVIAVVARSFLCVRVQLKRGMLTSRGCYGQRAWQTILGKAMMKSLSRLFQNRGNELHIKDGDHYLQLRLLLYSMFIQQMVRLLLLHF